MAGYKVVKGDTLGKIAARNGVTVADLMKWNPDIKNADLIRVGQNVNTAAPAGGGGTTTPAKPKPKGPNDTAKGTPKGEKGGNTGVGGGGKDPKTQLTILSGKEMKWYYDGKAGKWYVAYGLPNSDRFLFFEAAPDQMDALFGEGMRPVNFTKMAFSQISAALNSTFAGNIAEMEGKGTFEQEYQKVIDIALDNGELPSWMKGNKHAMDVLFIAQTENKNNDWVMDQWAKLPEFKARFPNIQKLKDQGNLTLQEAVTGFLEFEAGIKQSQTALGRSVAAITPAVIGGLLTRGWSLESANEALKVKNRMQKFGGAMSAFNKILAAKGLAPMTTEQQWFDFMQGRAPQAFYDIYEASSIQEAATQAGLGTLYDAQDAIDAALASDQTLESATAGMQEAAKLLLRLRGDIEMDRFDLDREDLIDASLGLKPSSGVSEAELFDRVNRATLSAQSALQRRRARPYTAFSKEGVPQTTSLGALRQES